MIDDTAILIPARGGSKNIKNKNLKIFNNKPLIYWTLKQALNSKFKKNIFVSSDSPKIIEYSKLLGAQTILRPKKISSDTSSTEKAILHFISNSNKKFKNIILLQPTSPLRKNKDINLSFNLFIKKKCKSLFSVSSFSDFTVWKKTNKKITPFSYDPKKRLMRQKNNKFFIENGSIYIFKTDFIKRSKNRIDLKSFEMYQMNKLQFFEIDDIEDFKICEFLFRENFF